MKSSSRRLIYLLTPIPVFLLALFVFDLVFDGPLVEAVTKNKLSKTNAVEVTWRIPKCLIPSI